jgi:hypothetical protein
MSTSTIRTSPGATPPAPVRTAVRRSSRRVSTETKASFKTSEFWIYLAVVAAILVASLMIGDDNSVGGAKGEDYFRADKAWLYIVIATVGYLFSRGLAKAGSRDFYDDELDTDGSADNR